MIISKNLKIDTKDNFQIIDITKEIDNLLNNLDISNGILNIFSKHSTTAIVINENESGLLNDFKKSIGNLIPEHDNYKHDLIDNNAAAHLKSFLLSSSETIPINNNKLDLGTWQSIFFIELDGPRKNRNIKVTVIGE